MHVIIPLKQPYIDLPGNRFTHLSDSGTDGEEMANRNSRPGRLIPSEYLPIPSPAPTTPLQGTSTTIDRSPSPATGISGPVSQVTNSEFSTAVTMIERLERRMAAMESQSMPASSSIAAPVPQPVAFPIAQPQVAPTAPAAGGRVEYPRFSTVHFSAYIRYSS